ncbi:MAG TPA: hypothetical protein VIC03_00550 [Gemmatimonadaceae bacterium]
MLDDVRPTPTTIGGAMASSSMDPDLRRDDNWIPTFGGMTNWIPTFGGMTPSAG